jgi:hypothetical protein
LSAVAPVAISNVPRRPGGDRWQSISWAVCRGVSRAVKQLLDPPRSLGGGTELEVPPLNAQSSDLQPL